jgi:ABC-type phosphate/phosphonate transport system substrate-binding protein
MSAPASANGPSIAAFPMYDRPETAPIYDRLWQATRDALGHGPATLTRGPDLWDIWQSPDLLIAQTCGLPFRSRLKGQVTLIGTPDPGLPDLAPGQYQSLIVVHRDAPARRFADLAGQRFAYNEALSQSGWAALAAHAAQRNTPLGPLLQTGSHTASARAVAEGRAAAASLDRVTWQLLAAFEPFARDLRILEQTEPTPALPLITALGRDPAPLRAALSRGLAALSPDERALIGFTRLIATKGADYFAIPLPPTPPQGGLTQSQS